MATASADGQCDVSPKSRGDTFRLNGRARIVSRGPGLGGMVVAGHRPAPGLLVDVDEVFFHCPKAFRRGRTWSPDTWRPGAVRSYADIAVSLWRKGQDEAQVQRHHQEHVCNESLY